jgi:antagonist of KipI
MSGGGAAAFRVLNTGGPATVQDLGRPGMGGMGLSTGGAYDRAATKAANAAVGNPEDAAVLEVTGQGLSLEATSTTVVAWAGGDAGILIDGRRATPGLSHLVRGGSKLSVAGSGTGSSSKSFRVWLAIQGGFDVPLVLGSRSTALSAGFGGYGGRPLATGDLLRRGPSGHAPGELAGRLVPEPAKRAVEAPLRVVPFDGPQSAGRALLGAFASARWKVSVRSDRIGTRLEGDGQHALRGGPGELTSFGVVRGAIQLTPDGTPIILGPEHQTTGGYPLLGVLAEADWGRISQAAPGDVLTFEVITLAEAGALAT